MLRTIGDDLVKVKILETFYSKFLDQEDKEQHKTLLKAKALRPKVELVGREIYARFLERRYLEEGIDATVRAIGKGKRTLLYRHVFVTRAYVFSTMNNNIIPEATRNFGFKEIRFENLLDQRWVHSL